MNHYKTANDLREMAANREGMVGGGISGYSSDLEQTVDYSAGRKSQPDLALFVVGLFVCTLPTRKLLFAHVNFASGSERKPQTECT